MPGVDHAERYAAVIDRPQRDEAPGTRVQSAGGRMSARVRRTFLGLQLAMAATDVASVVIAFGLAMLVHDRVMRTQIDVWMALIVAPALVVGVFSAFRLYSAQRMAAAEEFRRLLLAVTLIVTTAVTFSFWSKASFSRLWIAGSWAISLVLVLFTRYEWRSYIRRQRERGRLALRTLIIGSNAEAGRVAKEMRRAAFGFVPLGYVCADGWGRPTTDIPMLGHLDELSELIRSTDADCVFVASSSIHPEHMAQISTVARREGVEIRITANVQEILSTRVTAQPLGTLMAFSLRPVRLSGLQAAAKRSFDITLTAGALVVLSPLLGLVALAVRLTSRGPVLFRQVRVGYRGRPFTLLKFRTMVTGAEEMLDDLLERNEATGPLFKIADDPRVTGVGTLLRRWSLDELPQLWNVLVGDMSLVGPRPPLPREVGQYEDWMMARLEVRPGLTGLWQVSGRSDLPFDDYVRLDLFYIENWSLAYDLFIIAKTVPTLVTARGAH
jgi:exopolysaccharide biosynthesis polyprenyl glycosylphosphotransferase